MSSRTFLPLLVFTLFTTTLATNLLIPARQFTSPSHLLLRRQREPPPACTTTEPTCGPFCLAEGQECCGGGGTIWYYCQANFACFKDTLQCCPDEATDEECMLIVTPVEPPPPGPTSTVDTPTTVEPPSETTTESSTTSVIPEPETTTIVASEPSTIMGTITGTDGPVPVPTNGTIVVPTPTFTPPDETAAASSISGGMGVALGMGVVVAWFVAGL